MFGIILQSNSLNLFKYHISLCGRMSKQISTKDVFNVFALKPQEFVFLGELPISRRMLDDFFPLRKNSNCFLSSFLIQTKKYFFLPSLTERCSKSVPVKVAEHLISLRRLMKSSQRLYYCKFIKLQLPISGWWFKYQLVIFISKESRRITDCKSNNVWHRMIKKKQEENRTRVTRSICLAVSVFFNSSPIIN